MDGKMSSLGPSKHVNIHIHIYKTTQVHQTITGKHNLHFHTKKHIHKHSYLTYTMHIQTCTLYHL